MQLVAEPESCFSRNYVLTLDGSVLGSVDARTWSEDQDVRLAGGRRYALEKQGLFSSHFLLRDVESGQVLAEAERAGVFRSSWRLRIEGRPAMLERAGLFSRVLNFVAGGQIVGTVEPLSMFSRGFVVEADAVSDTSLLLAALVTLVIQGRAAAQRAASS